MHRPAQPMSSVLLQRRDAVPPGAKSSQTPAVIPVFRHSHETGAFAPVPEGPRPRLRPPGTLKAHPQHHRNIRPMRRPHPGRREIRGNQRPALSAHAFRLPSGFLGFGEFPANRPAAGCIWHLKAPPYTEPRIRHGPRPCRPGLPHPPRTVDGIDAGRVDIIAFF